MKCQLQNCNCKKTVLVFTKGRDAVGDVLLRTDPRRLDGFPHFLDKSFARLDPCRSLHDFRFDGAQPLYGGIELDLGDAERFDEG